MIHVAYIFSEYQTGSIAGHSFESIPWFSKTDFFEKKKKNSLLSSKYIFKAPLNTFYDLEPIIHVVYIFAEY